MRFSTLSAWLAWQETLHPQAIDLSLDRVRAVQQRLGLTNPKFAVIAVGGTNGKGSSVAMLEAIFIAAGYRVGAYTSPHLLRYNERVRANGAEASDEELCAAFARVDAARGDVSLTYFEFGTLAALDIFFRADLDVAVLEVGMGGRLDAVNILDADVALVTTVDLDHMAWLGPDRETIAFEKAGIFRAGSPAVFGERDAPRSLVAHAQNVGAELHCFERDFGFRVEGNTWSWRGLGRERHALPLPVLRGAYQLQNAAGVLTVLELLAQRLPVSQAQVREGLSTAHVPGRFQVFPGDVTRIVDVAHNPHAARALAQTLRAHVCTGRTLAVAGMLADKDRAATFAALKDVVDVWYVGPVSNERAASVEELLTALQQAGVSTSVEAAMDIKAAYRLAQEQARTGDRIIVFGSFYAVAAVLQEIL